MKRSTPATGAYTLFFCKIPSPNIALLKFTLESYEGLGVLRTLNRKTGEVVILAPEDSREAIAELLESCKDDYQIQILTAPQSMNEDWLLASAADDGAEG